MQTDLLFDQFDALLTTPDDVAHLEATILQLAVRGKLVPQDPNDEPATELLKRIWAEKEQLVHEGETHETKRLPFIKDAEIPYELPASWMWVRLPEIYRDWGQKKPDEDFTYIDVSAINKELGVIGDDLQVISPEDAPSRARKIVKRGTVIYSTVRPYLLNIAIVDKDFAPPPIVSTAFAIMYPLGGVVNKYLYYYLRSQPFIDFVESQMTGMAYPAISDSKLRLGLFPLPPFAEQKRIVAKVDALLAQTRALATQLEQTDAALVPAAQAAFQSLLDAQDTTAQHEAWQRITDHFDTLTSDPRTIDALKQTVLQLAVQGKLVPQDPDDEPASVLIERIEAEQAQMVREGKMKKPKRPPPISEEPHKLPEGWSWTRFPEIGELARGKSKHRPRNAPKLYENGKYPFIQTGDVAQSGGRITTYTAMYGDLGLAQSRMWKRGTLCITIAANIAETGILQFDACFPDSVVGFIPASLIGSPEYFQYFVKVAKSQLEAYAPATAQKNINLGILQNLLVPLPPANEIKRIVAKVEALLTLCDALAAEVAAAEEVRARLLQAVLNGG